MIKDGQGKPTDILCLVCEEVIKVPQYVPPNYKGDLVCQNCKSLMHIKLVNSQVAEYQIKEDKSKSLGPLKELANLKRIAKEMDEEKEKMRGRG